MKIVSRATTREGLTIAEVAIKLQCSQTNVRRLVEASELTTLDDGSIDPLNFDDTAAEAGKQNLYYWKTANEEMTVKLKGLSYDLKSGIQVNREIVEHSVGTALAVCAEGIKGLASRLAPLCFGATEREIHDIILDAGDVLLTSLAVSLENYAETADTEACDEEACENA